MVLGIALIMVGCCLLDGDAFSIGVALVLGGMLLTWTGAMLRRGRA